MITHWVGIGEVKSAGEGAQLCSILGSCVSTVLWQPEQKFAVMNHILLPRRGRNHHSAVPDGRFAEESWRMMQTRLARQGICLNGCIAFVAGGGNIVDTLINDIGAKNIECMKDMLEMAGISVHTANVGGNGHRTARFDPVTGEFKVKQSRSVVRQLTGQSVYPNQQAA